MPWFNPLAGLKILKKKKKEKKKINYSPKTPCLTSSITKCVTINRTTTAINHGIDLHAYLHKKNSEFTPREIAKDVPSICIVDNDEFKIDTLTDNVGDTDIYVQTAYVS